MTTATSSAKRFNLWSSVSDPSRYSGWATGYDLYYRGKIFRVRQGEGVLYRPASASLIDDTGGGEPAGDEVDVNFLPEKVQEAMGITVRVPDQHVLVLNWDCGADAKSWDGYGFKIFEAGTLVPPSRLRNAVKEGRLLADGQAGIFSKRGFGHHSRPVTYKVTCLGGKAVTEEDRTEQKQFASAQLELLKLECGLSHAEARAVMKEGGPGAVQKGVEWLRECQDAGFSEDAIRLVLQGVESNPEWSTVRLDDASAEFLGQGLSCFDRNRPLSGQAKKTRDAIDILFDGVLGVRFGRARIEVGLKELGLPVPIHYNARSLTSALVIAKAIVATGKFPLR